jgi:hypothetical protein
LIVGQFDFGIFCIFSGKRQRIRWCDYILHAHPVLVALSTASACVAAANREARYAHSASASPACVIIARLF